MREYRFSFNMFKWKNLNRNWQKFLWFLYETLLKKVNRVGFMVLKFCLFWTFCIYFKNLMFSFWLLSADKPYHQLKKYIWTIKRAPQSRTSMPFSGTCHLPNLATHSSWESDSSHPIKKLSSVFSILFSSFFTSEVLEVYYKKYLGTFFPVICKNFLLRL